MDVVRIAVDVGLLAGATVLLMMLLGTLGRRLLGVRMNTGRVVLASVLGLAAGVGFESRFVWGAADATPALIPVLLGIIVLVAVAVLVAAELTVPQGSLPRPDQWPTLGRQALERQRRYSQLLRILARHRLVTLRPGARDADGPAERRARAEALLDALEEAGGGFVKVGQLLSTRADVLPPEFVAALGALQQRVAPVPWTEVDPVLEQAFGGPLDEVFAEFSTTPLAAASIGQVHAAVLRTREHVAVKVRRPGIVLLMERDLDIARRLSRTLARSSGAADRAGVEGLVDSLASSLRDELDYHQEALNIAALAEVQEDLPAETRVRIPRVHRDLSDDQVLVMEHVTGTTLASLRPGTIDRAAGRSLARRLLSAALAQIMEAGVFHSDLHPGNIVVDAEGRLVLLDFGSIGRIDSETRARLGDLLFAFSRRDSTAFADALFAFVDLAEVTNQAELRRDVGAFMARRLGPGARVEAALFGDVVAILGEHGLRVPPELTVPFRALATVEGSLLLLDPDVDLVSEAGRYAQARLREAARPSSVAQAFKDEALSALPMLRRLPHRVDRLTGDLAEGRLSVQVRMLADPRDRDFLRGLLDLAVVTVLVGVFGVMAAVLLASDTGPVITETLTLFQLFGYLFLVLCGVLTLRALFEVLRRPAPSHRKDPR